MITFIKSSLVLTLVLASSAAFAASVVQQNVHICHAVANQNGKITEIGTKTVSSPSFEGAVEACHQFAASQGPAHFNGSDASYCPANFNGNITLSTADYYQDMGHSAGVNVDYTRTVACHYIAPVTIPGHPEATSSVSNAYHGGVQWSF